MVSNNALYLMSKRKNSLNQGEKYFPTFNFIAVSIINRKLEVTRRVPQK